MNPKVARTVKRILLKWGYSVSKVVPPEFARDIPDAAFYRPLFSPWLGHGDFSKYMRNAARDTLVSADRSYVLYVLAAQALNLQGEFWECGVYRGGTAHLLADLIEAAGPEPRPLRLFDTFAGMPDTDSLRDLHSKGDFADTSLEGVQKRIGTRPYVHYHQGFIPTTFSGLEGCNIAFAHIDVDIYRSVADSIEFIMPRLVPGGFVVFDDYGFPTCPGARQAVDEYFVTRREKPLVLPSGQAIVFNSFGRA